MSEKWSARKWGSGKINRDWNDDDVLPARLSIDTEFVFRRMTDETIRAVDLKNAHRVLDIGCGRGIDAASLAQSGGVLYGCEPSRIMLRKAKEWKKKTGQEVQLVSSLAEELPFANQVFSRVFCKGAIDHFLSPEQAFREMCRVTSGDGKVIVSVANFESLSCLGGRKLNHLSLRLFHKEISPPRIWEIPKDHTFRFDFQSLLQLARQYLKIDRIQGISLFWGFPQWPNFLRRIPRPLALTLLRFFDKVASWYPCISDVLIITGRPIQNLPAEERS
jgi:ubiquinone/menaquinone biosynthesis C-methylase UbiE